MKALARASRRAWRTSTLTAAAIILLSTVGADQVLARLRPQALNDAVARFEQSWNGNDLEGIETLFVEGVRSVESSELRSVAAGHGWTQKLPPLEEARLEELAQSATLEYELPEGALIAEWTLENNRWVLAGLELPYPSLDSTLELFVESWTLASPEDLVSFFSEEKRSEMLTNLENAKQKRGWITFPEVKRVDAAELDPRETTVVLLVDGGEVTTKWHFRQDGTWGLHGLRLPTHRIRKQD